MLRSAMLQRNWQEESTALEAYIEYPAEPLPPGGYAVHHGHAPKRIDHGAKCIK